MCITDALGIFYNTTNRKYVLVCVREDVLLWDGVKIKNKGEINDGIRRNG